VRWSTSPVLESSAAWVESSEVMPRPMTRRPVVEPAEPDALRDPPVLALLLLALFPEPPLELRAPLLELPFPLLAPIPPLLRFGMLTLG
jgi:hypothetical protein